MTAFVDPNTTLDQVGVSVVLRRSRADHPPMTKDGWDRRQRWGGTLTTTTTDDEDEDEDDRRRTTDDERMGDTTRACRGRDGMTEPRVSVAVVRDPPTLTTPSPSPLPPSLTDHHHPTTTTDTPRRRRGWFERGPEDLGSGMTTTTTPKDGG